METEFAVGTALTVLETDAASIVAVYLALFVVHYRSIP